MLYSRPWSLELNVVLEAISHKCFQTKRSKKPIRRKKKNPRWRAKSERLLAASLTICEINEIHLWNSWKEHQKLKLKLFILPISKSVYISFTFTLYILIPFSMGAGRKPPPPYLFLPVTSTNVGISPRNFLTLSFNSFATLVQYFMLIPPYLVPVQNYSTWSKNTPQKKRVFSGQIL